MGSALLIRRGRPISSVPWRASIARPSLSASAISTKAKPRLRPVSRSRGREQFDTSPKGANNSAMSSCSARKGRLPTKMLTGLGGQKAEIQPAKSKPGDAIRLGPRAQSARPASRTGLRSWPAGNQDPTLLSRRGGCGCGPAGASPDQSRCRPHCGGPPPPGGGRWPHRWPGQRRDGAAASAPGASPAAGDPP